MEVLHKQSEAKAKIMMFCSGFRAHPGAVRAKRRRNIRTMALARVIIRLTIVIFIVTEVPLQTPSQKRQHPAKRQGSADLQASVE